MKMFNPIGAPSGVPLYRSPDLVEPTASYDAARKTMTVDASQAGGDLSKEVFISQQGNSVTVEVVRQSQFGEVYRSFFKYDNVDALVVKTGDTNDYITTYNDTYTGPNNYPNPNVTVGLTVDAGGGNDLVIGSNGANTLIGGAGNDRLIGGSQNDVVFAGSGDDYVETGQGDDELHGEDGSDTLYGGQGNDKLIDESGPFNYLEGGKGDDYLLTQGGHNIISGGRDNDRIVSYGEDVIYTGDGADIVENHNGDDKVYGQTDQDKMLTSWPDRCHPVTFIDVPLKEPVGGIKDFFSRHLFGNPPKMKTLGTSIQLEGSDEFKDRMEDDLDQMRSSPVGKDMLRALDDNGHTVTIREPTTTLSATETGDASSRSASKDAYLLPPSIWGQRNVGSDATVSMTPSHQVESANVIGWMPPSVFLHHELAHAYNSVTGTIIPGEEAENQAIGLPVTAYSDNPRSLTENGLREEFGIPLRTVYVKIPE